MSSARTLWTAPCRIAAVAVIAVACAACTGAPRTAPPSQPVAQAPDSHTIQFGVPHEIVTRDRAYLIRWEPVGGAIPINEDFEVDLFVTRNDEEKTPVEGASVSMTCFMPDHGHGMLREPVSEELGGGRYRAKGFLLHMDGFWTVSATVMVNGIAASADDELRL